MEGKKALAEKIAENRAVNPDYQLSPEEQDMWNMYDAVEKRQLAEFAQRNGIGQQKQAQRNKVDFNDYYVYMYRTNMNDNPLFVRDEEHNGNIGIQVFYTVNGVKNASEIAWLYDIDTNVAETLAGKTVANVRYFNVAGQEMAQPNGLTIMVTTYTDGTTNAVKVVK